MNRDIARPKSIFENPALICLALLLFQRLVSLAGGAAADLGDYRGMDPYGIFMWISVHHVVQLAFTTAAIALVSRRTGLDFGLDGGNRWKGFKYTLAFCGAMLAYVLVSNCIGWLTGNIQQAAYPLNATNVAGTLGFQLLLSGPAEELLFRAMPITMLTACGGHAVKRIGLGRASLSYAMIISAALFAFAHINIEFPFQISYNGFQLVYAFVLGLIYGKVFEVTGSIIYPAIMHSMSNVLMVGAGYIFQTLVA